MKFDLQMCALSGVPLIHVHDTMNCGELMKKVEKLEEERKMDTRKDK